MEYNNCYNIQYQYHDTMEYENEEVLQFSFLVLKTLSISRTPLKQRGDLDLSMINIGRSSVIASAVANPATNVQQSHK